MCPSGRHDTDKERERLASLLAMIPRGRRSVLDVGARDGYVTGQLAALFESVTALDLEAPQIAMERVTCVAGDATRLDFSDDSFDAVVCTEVLEHIPCGLLEKACAEIARVARYDVVIGVPYRQDLRLHRTTCRQCGKVNPPWGHVNSFDEGRLRTLFGMLTPVASELVGPPRRKTNALSAWLMNLAGNPWGSYSQAEPCIYCGAKLRAPAERSVLKKACSKAAHFLGDVQGMFSTAQRSWIHMLFEKRRFAGAR